jgi:hypothetical protein
MDNQLKLFEDRMYLITYWTHPFNSEGEYIKEYMQKFEELIPEHRLYDFVSMLNIINCRNIKYTQK